MKKIISMILIVCIFISTTSNVFGVSPYEDSLKMDNDKIITMAKDKEVEYFTINDSINNTEQVIQDEFIKANLIQSSVNDLQKLAQRASNDIEAMNVYNELIERIKNSEMQSSAIIDTYFTHYSTSISGTSIDVYYRVKALVPSGASLYVGYEYPSITRTSGSSISLMGKSVGTYHAYFTSKGLRCYSRTYASFLAGSYSEKEIYDTYLAFNTSPSYAYHTVTSAEATINKVTLTAATLYTTLTFPPGSAAAWTSIIVSGVSIGTIWSTAPGLNANQYIELYTYYSGGRMYQRIKIWHNKTAYNNDYGNPMYSNTSSASSPAF